MKNHLEFDTHITGDLLEFCNLCRVVLGPDVQRSGIESLMINFVRVVFFNTSFPFDRFSMIK